MKKTLLCLSSLAIGQSNAAVAVIDNFNSGATSVSVSGAGASIDTEATSGLSGAATVGGIRVAQTQKSEPGVGTSEANVTGGEFEWNNDNDVNSVFDLAYGFSNLTNSVLTPGDWVAEADANPNDLNLDLSTADSITVNISFIDVSGVIRLGVVTDHGGLNSVNTLSELVIGGGVSTVVTFDLSSLVNQSGGAINLADVDQIVITGTAGSAAADWRIDSIEAIPEPSTALLGLLGLMGLARRRR